jgi:hypothetical protein
MGTNFYWKIPAAPKFVTPLGDEIETDVDRHNLALHIGKRSASGLYCWDCGVTLCKGGEERIHYGDNDWHDVCPKCGKGPAGETLNDGSAAGVELGFSKAPTVRPTGVRSCASFSWGQDPKAVMEVCIRRKDEEIIVNEYGDAFTGDAFLDVLTFCPVRYTDCIGVCFS